MSGTDSTAPVIGTDVCHGPCGATVLEGVLLAIINAHTSQETEGWQGERLEVTMRALIGPTTPSERGMERALMHMARQRQKDVCAYDMRALQVRSVAPMPAVRSVPELATAAARQILGCTHASEVQATARVLCKMFRQRRTGHAVEHDLVREARETEAVQRLCDELAEWDVSTRL